MGIVKEILSDFETESGQSYTIEYNENNHVHIHTGHVRLDLTEEEFLELVESVSEGKQNLVGIKDDIGTE